MRPVNSLMATNNTVTKGNKQATNEKNTNKRAQCLDP